MKKDVPFVPNSEDGMHCVPAVFRMLYQYYFDEDVSWEAMDRIMHVVPGKGTWTFPALTSLAQKGLDVVHIEPVDYEKLFKEGTSYLRTVVGEKTADYYIKQSNIATVLPFIPQYLKTVKQEIRESSTDEAIAFLEKGYLVTAEINPRILNNKPGFSLHYVLLYDWDGRYITLHDPGLPPVAARKVTREAFDACFAYEGANKSITALKKM